MKQNVITARYEGGAFKPLRASKKYDEGETYYLRVEYGRNIQLHKAFMATIREAWESLPDHLQKLEFPTEEVLRKRLLIATKDERLCAISSMACADKDDATHRAALIAKHASEHTFISVHDNIVVIATAHSQAMDEMDGETFKASCKLVMSELARLLKCDVDDIKKRIADMRAQR